MRLFPDLSVLENVELGGVGVGMRRTAARSWALELLERLGLADRTGSELVLTRRGRLLGGAATVEALA